MSRLIEKQFQSFRSVAFPHATGSEYTERRRMFYAGFQACLTTAEGASDEQIEQTVKALHEELQEFAIGMVEGNN